MSTRRRSLHFTGYLPGIEESVGAYFPAYEPLRNFGSILEIQRALSQMGGKRTCSQPVRQATGCIADLDGAA